MSRMQRLAQPANSIDAHLLRDRLAAERIAATVHGDLLQGGAGELPASGLVEVWVSAADLARARQVLAGFEAAAGQPGALVVPADAAHLAALPAIERAAATLFSPEDLPAALRDQTTAAATLAAAAADGRLLVAVVPSADDGSEQAVGFALLGAVDGLPHLLELSVHPDHSRQGLGRSLVQGALELATASGARAITLTTYSHLPWNRPFYASLGFTTVATTELTPGLADILQAEAAAGLRGDLRIAMRRPLP